MKGISKHVKNNDYLFHRATFSRSGLGGYLIFWFAFLKGTPRLNCINNETDLSYGTYLYAWPIQSLLIKFIPGITPLSVVILTTFSTAALAYLSWRLIEKPSLSLRPVLATDKPQPTRVRQAAGWWRT